MKRWLVLCLLLLVASPLFAQSHADVVAAVKASLVASGTDLSGPCGAYSITRRVAWQLRAEGAGTLDKPSGNNCEGRATDIVAFPDGRIVDILIDGGGANGPTWAPGDPVDASRWRAAVDPGGSVPPVTPPPVTPPTDLGPILSRLSQFEGALTAVVEQLSELQKDATAQRRAVQLLNDQVQARTADVQRIDAYLSSRPIPTGCNVRFFGCQLVVP